MFSQLIPWSVFLENGFDSFIRHKNVSTHTLKPNLVACSDFSRFVKSQTTEFLILTY